MQTDQWLNIHRTVRFGDTDAAGVMHFHQLLRWSHEAWEESLQSYGLDAAAVFPGTRNGPSSEIALPIVHCSAEFMAPLHVGDDLCITLEPTQLDPGSFEVRSRFTCQEQAVATGCLRHLAIHARTRRRTNLPEAIDRWLEASNVGKLREL